MQRFWLEPRHCTDGLRTDHDLLEVLFSQRLQHIHGRTGEQGRVDLEGRVFGGGADESEEATFNMWQKCVLLAFIEAVHLVDEHDGALRMQPSFRGLGFFDRLADVLHPAQHRTDADELRIEGFGHQARNRGLAHARRPPEDAAVGLPGLESQAQGHAFAQNVLLADHLAQRAGTQPFCQGSMQGLHGAWVRAGSRPCQRAAGTGRHRP